MLWTSGWTPRFTGETIYLAPRHRRPASRRSQDAARGPRRRRHGDGVPVAESDGDGTTVESHETLRASDGRPQPGHADPPQARRHAQVVKRQGQESFNFGDFFAYSKICTHLGCPASLYEQQTNRILCPCHQSQFDALQFAKPIFGPPPARWRSCRSPWTRRDTWSPTATSSNPSDRPSGSGSIMSPTTRRTLTPGASSGRLTSSTRATTRRRRLRRGSSTRSSRRTGRSCSARSRCTASSSCCSPAST